MIMNIGKKSLRINEVKTGLVFLAMGLLLYGLIQVLLGAIIFSVTFFLMRFGWIESLIAAILGTQALLHTIWFFDLVDGLIPCKWKKRSFKNEQPSDNV